MTLAAGEPCPCGKARTYGRCCGPLHQGRIPAQTAEQLMRSRYSAFAAGRPSYLRDTLHPSRRPAFDLKDTREWIERTRWTGLVIIGTTGGSPVETSGTVRFEARYVEDGQPRIHHEHSLFEKHKGRWYYVRALD
ncbi:MAG: YchJ family protein [Geminicoccaceae bacterium]|nr:YchJ family protein [Geminicoccaceae bacterium]